MNPEHLYAGTQKQNMHDRAKDCIARGERPIFHFCQFTVEQLAEIRASNLSQVALAKKFGVSPSYMSRLVTKKRGKTHADVRI